MYGVFWRKLIFFNVFFVKQECLLCLFVLVIIERVGGLQELQGANINSLFNKVGLDFIQRDFVTMKNACG